MANACRLGYLAGLATLLGSTVTLPALAQQTGPRKEECLEVRVLDPSSASIPGATVTVGDREKMTDGSGVAAFCDPGPGPHRVVVSAEDFEVHEGSVESSRGSITVILQLLLVSSHT